MAQMQPRLMPRTVGTAARPAPPDGLAELRLAEMRRMLDRMTGTTTADRLHALREYFPDIPLQTRVAALMHR